MQWQRDKYLYLHIHATQIFFLNMLNLVFKKNTTDRLSPHRKIQQEFIYIKMSCYITLTLHKRAGELVQLLHTFFLDSLMCRQ